MEFQVQLTFQTLEFFVTLFSRTVRPRRLKLGTHVDSGEMYHVYRNQAAAAYLSLYFIFLSLQFSTFKFFCHTNYEALKIENWYTRGQWADVSCILESDCCSYLSLYFFTFLSLQFSNIKIFCHFFQELWGLEDWNLVHMWIVGRCIVFTGIRLLLLICPFISSFFFSLQLSNIKTFRHIFLRNCEV